MDLSTLDILYVQNIHTYMCIYKCVGKLLYFLNLTLGDFGGGSLIKPPFGVALAEVAIICQEICIYICLLGS